MGQGHSRYETEIKVSDGEETFDHNTRKRAARAFEVCVHEWKWEKTTHFFAIRLVVGRQKQYQTIAYIFCRISFEKEFLTLRRTDIRYDKRSYYV